MEVKYQAIVKWVKDWKVWKKILHLIFVVTLVIMTENKTAERKQHLSYSYKNDCKSYATLYYTTYAPSMLVVYLHFTHLPGYHSI